MDKMDINDENIEQITAALTERGFVVKPKEEIDGLAASYEALKKQEIKTIWDTVDKTIHEITGKEKQIREDNGLERSVNYYQRSLKEGVEEKKQLEKANMDLQNQFKALSSELEALKSENPEAKYEEKYSALKADMKALQEAKQKELEDKDNDFRNQLFLNETNALVSALRGQFRDDIPDVEDGIETKIRRIQGLTAKEADGRKVYYKNGEPQINESGAFSTLEDIVRGEFANYIIEKKQVAGTGSTGQKLNGSAKSFGTKAEVEAHLKEKYQGGVGSREWIAERKELLANSGLQ